MRPSPAVLFFTVLGACTGQIAPPPGDGRPPPGVRIETEPIAEPLLVRTLLGWQYQRTIGALLGSGIPLLFHRLKIDPAVASNPFITSMCDICGLVLYLQIAQLFLD